MYVGMYICVYMSVYMNNHVCRCVCVCVYACMYICMYVYKNDIFASSLCFSHICSLWAPRTFYHLGLLQDSVRLAAHKSPNVASNLQQPRGWHGWANRMASDFGLEGQPWKPERFYGLPI